MLTNPSQPVISALKKDVESEGTPKARPTVLGGGPREAARNLGLGVGVVLVALPLGALAFWLAPRESFSAVLTGVLLGLLVFLSIQFRLLLQRHGTFLLLGVGLLLTLAVPLCVSLGITGTEWVRELIEFRRGAGGDRSQQSGGTGARGPVSGAPAVPGAPGVSGAFVAGAAAAQMGGRPGGGGVGATPVQNPTQHPTQHPTAVTASVGTEAAQKAMAHPASSELLLNNASQISPLPPPAPAQPSQEPSLSPEAARKAEQALVEKLMAKLEAENPENATRFAQQEMVRRYPALEDPNSPESSAYRTAYNELARLRKFDFFKNPRWPLKIADEVAAREGWVRADLLPAPAGAGEAGSGPGDIPARNAAPGTVSAARSLLPGGEVALDRPDSPPPQNSEEEEEKRAMIEARRRYPAVGESGSAENRAYLEVYEELRRLRPNFFTSPDWPVRLVELVAKREGWTRTLASETPSGGKSTELPLPR